MVRAPIHECMHGVVEGGTHVQTTGNGNDEQNKTKQKTECEMLHENAVLRFSAKVKC